MQVTSQNTITIDIVVWNRNQLVYVHMARKLYELAHTNDRLFINNNTNVNYQKIHLFNCAEYLYEKIQPTYSLAKVLLIRCSTVLDRESCG